MQQNETELNKEKLLGLSEISLWLDTYDDIFSDFDPRPFNERGLSVDFLDEARRAAREKPFGKLALKFLIPAAKRNQFLEAQIKKRLSSHFKENAIIFQRKVNALVKLGAGFIIAGIIVMFFATVILFSVPEKNFWASFLVILLEPAGWFFFWEGLNQIIFHPKKLRKELEFYKKMENCGIKFLPY